VKRDLKDWCITKELALDRRVEASNSCARTLIFGSFHLLSFVFFSLPLFRFFDLVFYYLFSFFIWFFYHALFSPSFLLLFYTCFYVVSSLAYLNLGIKGLVVVVVVSGTIVTNIVLLHKANLSFTE
jgi:hypothetical protein